MPPPWGGEREVRGRITCGHHPHRESGRDYLDHAYIQPPKIGIILYQRQSYTKAKQKNECFFTEKVGHLELLIHHFYQPTGLVWHCSSYMRNRTPLAAQSKVGYRKPTRWASMSQHMWCGTDGTYGVGTLDPLLMGPSSRPN